MAQPAVPEARRQRRSQRGVEDEVSAASLADRHAGEGSGDVGDEVGDRAARRAARRPGRDDHALRHTWASHAVMNGVPLLVVAKNLGHADTRMVEKHYGHLAPSYIADAIRAGAPKFGFKPNPKIAMLATKGVP